MINWLSNRGLLYWAGLVVVKNHMFLNEHSIGFEEWSLCQRKIVILEKPISGWNASHHNGVSTGLKRLGCVCQGVAQQILDFCFISFILRKTNYSCYLSLYLTRVSRFLSSAWLSFLFHVLSDTRFDGISKLLKICFRNNVSCACKRRNI